jgi:uncharacterized membrane protein
VSRTNVGAARRPRTARWPRALSLRVAFREQLVAIAVAGAVLLVLVAVDAPWLPLEVVRAILGLGFFLLVPGYSFQAALFPRADDLDVAERLALSFGLSLAVLSPIAYLLNYLPWGIRLWPTAVALGVWIAACLGVAWLRRRRLGIAGEVGIRLEMDPAWWARRGRRARASTVVLLAGLLVVLGAAFAVAVLPRPGERLTEFYALGSAGLAEDYPREVVVGEPVEVVVGIVNAEGISAEYRVAAVSAGRTLGAAGPLQVPAGERIEQVVRFAPDRVDADTKVELLLYRDGSTSPYRELRIWMSVRSAR